MSLPLSPVLDFSPWVFLTTPLLELLGTLDAEMITASFENPDFFAAIAREDDGLKIVVPAGRSVIETEAAVRGALAYWFDVETSDWPLEIRFTPFAVPCK